MTDLEGKNADDDRQRRRRGWPTGPIDKAAFNRPQGMCLVGDILYVADTENHAIRAVDLKAKTVTTVAGDGKQSNRRAGSGPGKTTGLNSPWDVLLLPGHRSAGDRDGRPAPDLEVRHLVGRRSASGPAPASRTSSTAPSTAARLRPAERPGHRREEPLRGRLGGLRRPRDHARQADAPSCRRSSGSGLFDFGDVDGQGSQVRLQHCLGLAYGDGKLYIADSYNNKIKVCDPKTRSVKTFLGDTEAGTTDDPAPVRRAGRPEPGRHDPLRGRHQQPQDPGGRHRTRERSRPWSSRASSPPPRRRRPPSFSNAVVTNAPAVKVAPGDSVKLEVALSLPPGYKVTDQAPMPYLIETPGKEAILSPDLVATVRKRRPAGADSSPSMSRWPSPPRRATPST